MRFADAAEGSGAARLFGNNEAGVGDVNGDGFADVVVAGAHYSGTRYLQGRVALYLGNRAGRLGTPAWTALGDSAGQYFGAYVAAAGDVNGDGLADVLVTDLCARAGDHQEGALGVAVPGLSHRARAQAGLARGGLAAARGSRHGGSPGSAT
jgi:hypothetical protein